MKDLNEFLVEEKENLVELILYLGEDRGKGGRVGWGGEEDG